MSKPLTFGEHLRAQRLSANGHTPIIEAYPEIKPYAPPVDRPAPRARDHTQREAAARLRELREQS